MKTTKNIYADSISAINRLQNNGVLDHIESDVIVLKADTPIGIKLWGAIDYLIHYGGCTGWVRGIGRKK